MKVDVRVPGVGESITEGLLAAWAVQDGAAVIEGQALFELETDKTTIDVTAPATGTLSISVPEGNDVVIDQVVGVIDTDAPAAVDAKAAEGSKRSDEVNVAGNQDTSDTGPEVSPDNQRVTPGAKAAAARAGLDMGKISAGGRDGMLTKADVLAEGNAAEPVTAKGSETAAESGEKPQSDTSSAADHPVSNRAAERRKPMSRIRRTIARNLAQTRDELVLLTTFNEADMSTIKTLRSLHGERFKERHGVKLGFMSFFLKAAAAALEHYPEVNAYIDSAKDEVVYRDGIHISVAVSTPKGLVTPVLRNVQNMSFADVERGIIEFARKAEGKTLMPDDLVGGSFAVTNGGIFGSMMSTPLPAPKQSAILGMHAIQDRPVARNGEVVIRPMMYLALSYDHRLIDGREAVGCLKAIKEGVEDPQRLLLEL